MPKKSSNKKSSTTYSIAAGNGVIVLERCVEKDGDEYYFYDVMIANTVILKDCRIVEGKNGMFLATPSTKRGDKYYPQAYVSEAVNTAVIDLVDDAEAWEETDTTYLEFNKGKEKKSGGRSTKKNSKRKSKDEDEDEDEDEYPF